MHGFFINFDKLAGDMDQLSGLLRRRVAEQLPKLDEAVRNYIVHLVECAMELKEREIADDDPAAIAAAKVLEPHQYAAMGLAASLAFSDGADYSNPFTNEQLRLAYQREKLIISN